MDKRTRTRRNGTHALERRGWLWAVAQVAVLAAEVIGLVLLLAQPGLRPTELRVNGLQHVSLAQVRAALDLPHDRSIFFINSSDLAKRLHSLVWVQSADVSLSLPNKVAVRIQEWSPAGVLQVGERSYYLNAQGSVLAPASEPAGLTVVSRPGMPEPRAGQSVVDAQLLSLLATLRQGFPAAFHLQALIFTLDAREALTLHTDRGYPIMFGQIATSDERAQLEPKLAALRAISQRLDLVRAPILYINLMNPKAPAVQMRAG
jgi:cell division septal protein FtsQ